MENADLQRMIANAATNGRRIVQELIDTELSWAEILAALGSALSAVIATMPPHSRNHLMESHISAMRETLRECEERLQ